MDLKKEPFGMTGDVFLFTLSNNKGMTVKITNYGATITSILVPDQKGKPGDVVLGFNTLQEYLTNHPYIGTIVGRYGNRIAKGRFVLNGKEYKLVVNNNENHLHGGTKGFDKVIWSGTEIKTSDTVGVRLSHLSNDGEEGYPGNLLSTVDYLLNNHNELTINYDAKTDHPTVINLTNHSYFNLNGEGSGDILGHEVMINADRYTAVSDSLIPTGELRAVKGSPLDFTVSQKIGARIGEVKGGYDHNYVLNKTQNNLSLAAKVYEPNSGRIMEVLTTEPGLQFYTGNFLDGTFTGKSGKSYQKHAGLCLEAQHYPDSPNHPEFPTTVLNPGDTYRQVTIYRFSI